MHPQPYPRRAHATTIRRATQHDAEAIAALGHHLHDESPDWSRFDYDPARVATMMRTLIGLQGGFVLVVNDGDRLVGGIAAMASPHWSSTQMVAQEMSFFLLPAYRGGATAVRLVRMLEQWASDQGCVRLQAGTSTGIEPERTARFYEALGFRRSVILLERWLKKD